MFINDFEPVEPLKENRFLINIIGTEIPSYLFRNYKMYNEGEELIFETSFFETVNFTFNPSDFFNITGVVLDFLDPTGAVCGGLVFDVKGSNFMRKQKYSNDDLQITKLRFVVEKKTLVPKFSKKN